ncbi:PPE domain-containing protein [Nocardia sp. NPDC050712]|uniref:PPE domain-containing protein n=1 Tax=Nocardia sp. NPDC050712 TaxID=3155518 RepID=UPI0033C94622
MIEPPLPGFTGVVWEAREAERLARELTTGPGAIPMAEAGVAWARLAADFGAAAVEYELIIAAVRTAWQSNTSNLVLERIAKLRDWMTEAAAAASENALKAEKQAASYELARLTMPNGGDIAAIEQVQRLLQQLGVMVGAPIQAIAAGTDEQADVAKAATSRVMRNYESSTEPLAQAWEQQPPPVLASSAALDSERSMTIAKSAPAPMFPGGMPARFTPPALGGFTAAPREKTAYRTPVLAHTDAPETVETVAPQVVPNTHPSSSLPFLPAGAAGALGAGDQQEEEYQSRAGDAGDQIGADLGIVSAPAVLGVPEAPTSNSRTGSGGAA